MGLEIARALTVKAAAPEVPAEQLAGEIAPAFATVSRAVRQTIALQAKLDRDECKRLRLRQEDEQELRRRAARTHARRRKVVISNLIEGIVGSEENLRDPENLLRHVEEWFEDDDAPEELAERPVRELVERIFCDLGYVIEPGTVSEETWAAAEAAAPPMSFAADGPRGPPPDGPWPAALKDGAILPDDPPP